MGQANLCREDGRGIGILSYFPRIQATFLSTERNFYMTTRAKSGLIGQVGTCTYIYVHMYQPKGGQKKTGARERIFLLTTSPLPPHSPQKFLDSRTQFFLGGVGWICFQKKKKGKSKTWGELSSIKFFWRNSFWQNFFMSFWFQKNMCCMYFFIFFFQLFFLPVNVMGILGHLHTTLRRQAQHQIFFNIT